MSGSRSVPPDPRTALEALMADPAGDPLRRALWLDALDRRLRPCLPPSVAAHARLANLSGNTLVFVVDSPAWNARLRLEETAVIDAARSVGLSVDAIVVRTATAPLPASRPVERPPMPMSPATRDALRAALDSLRDPDVAPDSDDAPDPG